MFRAWVNQPSIREGHMKNIVMKFLNSLAKHYTCWWCDMPMPDCSCPVSRTKLTANDNRPIIMMVGMP